MHEGMKMAMNFIPNKPDRSEKFQQFKLRSN